MIKKLAILTGIILLAVGILGFVPALAPSGHLFGLFHVNAAHNIVHIVSGLAALGAGMASVYAARMFFRVFGVIYGLVAILGFVYRDTAILGLLANNMADTWLHVIISLGSLWAGFMLRPETDHLPARTHV